MLHDPLRALPFPPLRSVIRSAHFALGKTERGGSLETVHVRFGRGVSRLGSEEGAGLRRELRRDGRPWANGRFQKPNVRLHAGHGSFRNDSLPPGNDPFAVVTRCIRAGWGGVTRSKPGASAASETGLAGELRSDSRSETDALHGRTGFTRRRLGISILIRRAFLDPFEGRRDALHFRRRVDHDRH